MDLKECYLAAGADYEDFIRRLGRSNRYVRFLEMFLHDENFQKLSDAMEAGKASEAFAAVHTLKGICMNLSLTALRDSCIKLTEDLRGGVFSEDTDKYWEETKNNYDKTASAIRAFVESNPQSGTGD